MAIQDNKITTWTNPIVNEADRPQRSAADMKSVFDSNSNQLKKALNGLIDALTQSGGGDIGASVEGMAGNNVQALIAELKGLIDAIEEYTDSLKTPSGAANVGAKVSGITGNNIAAVLAALKTLCDRVDTTGDGDLFLKNDGTYGLPTVVNAANGLPIGGKAGQFLKKASSVNFAGYWGGIVDEALSGLLKASNGELAAAEAGVDYAAPAADTVVTASTSAWSDNTITLSVTGVMADSKLEIGLSDTATDEQYAAATAAQIRATGSGNGTVTLKAATAPTIDLPIIIRRLS